MGWSVNRYVTLSVSGYFSGSVYGPMSLSVSRPVRSSHSGSTHWYLS